MPRKVRSNFRILAEIQNSSTPIPFPCTVHTYGHSSISFWPARSLHTPTPQYSRSSFLRLMPADWWLRVNGSALMKSSTPLSRVVPVRTVINIGLRFFPNALLRKHRSARKHRSSCRWPCSDRWCSIALRYLCWTRWRPLNDLPIAESFDTVWHEELLFKMVNFNFSLRLALVSLMCPHATKCHINVHSQWNSALTSSGTSTRTCFFGCAHLTYPFHVECTRVRRWSYALPLVDATKNFSFQPCKVRVQYSANGKIFPSFFYCSSLSSNSDEEKHIIVFVHLTLMTILVKWRLRSFLNHVNNVLQNLGTFKTLV